MIASCFVLLNLADGAGMLLAEHGAFRRWVIW